MTNPNSNNRQLALYARCSTEGQTTAPQLDALHAYAERRGAAGALVFEDTASGVKERPALEQLRAAVRRREIYCVVAVKLDRLARSVLDLCSMAEEMEACGCSLTILDQSIDTSTASGRLLFGVLASVAEFERSLIVERTLAGLAAARKRGRVGGRPPVLDAKGKRRALRLHASGHSLREVGRMLEVSTGTVHNVVKAARQ